MGHRDDELTPAELAEAEAATSRLLARWDEPRPAPPPAGLAGRVLAALPAAPRAARAPAILPRFAGWALAVGAILLLSFGAWGVWLDSAGPAGLLGASGAGLAGLVLQLTLTAKPLLNLLGASAGVSLAALAALLAGGTLWWRMVTAISPAPMEQAV